jgi:hypothetical protein
MHTHDVLKNKSAFHAEFQHILNQAGAGTADFTKFVFPEAAFAKRVFEAECIFRFAIFAGNIDFSRAQFMRRAEFFGVKFEEFANFAAATHNDDAVFSSAKFTQSASFHSACFNRLSTFDSAKFEKNANFEAATFAQLADFTSAIFAQGADFSNAIFAQDSKFWYTAFTKSASFVGAAFVDGAGFFGATFSQDANFNIARFTKNTYFAFAKFRGQATFDRTLFHVLADFSNTHFFGPAEFLDTQFRHDPEETEQMPGAVFTRAKFAKPEEVIFYHTYLGQALFHLCDVTRVNFSDVTWRKRRKSGKRMAFEEEVNLEDSNAEALRPAEGSRDKRNRVLIAELYQQLKKNYDDRRDYWTAGDFHYGEMEMKRLSSSRKNRLLRWLKRHLSLVALYKYANEYGESYVRPAGLLVLVLFTFGLLYPAAGLRYEPSLDSFQGVRVPAEPVDAYTYARGMVSLQDLINATRRPEAIVLTYWRPIARAEQESVGVWPARLYLVGHSLLAAILVPLFQRDLVYEPVYPWGRVLAVMEMTLTSTLFALFLLAVRRQFRR